MLRDPQLCLPIVRRLPNPQVPEKKLILVLSLSGLDLQDASEASGCIVGTEALRLKSVWGGLNHRFSTAGTRPATEN